MERGGDGDGVAGDGGDFEEFTAATGGIATGVAAAGGGVLTTLLQTHVITGGYTETGNGGKAGRQFVCSGAQCDGRAIVGIAVAGAADGHHSAGGGVVEDSATGTVNSDIGDVDGQLRRNQVGAARGAGEKQRIPGLQSTDGAVDGCGVVG